MERGRRNRKGRGNAYCDRNVNQPHYYTPPQTSKNGSFLSSLYTFLIMCSIIALIYMMLEYHCSQCVEKCNVTNVTKSIEEIAKNLSLIKTNYYDLEMTISKFSQDLPKLEGQIDILEALANTIENSRLAGWDPKVQLPSVDVFLNHPNIPSNITEQFSPQLMNAGDIADNI